VAGAVVALFVVVCVVRAEARPYRIATPPADSSIIAAPITIDRFRAALRFPTVSTQDSVSFDPVPFLDFHKWMAGAFPNVSRRLTREVVADYSLLYTWTGSDTTLDPVLLMGHLDVVPVEPGTESRWKHPPFAGEVADSYVWGRGTLDDKTSVIAILEAVESWWGRDSSPVARFTWPSGMTRSWEVRQAPRNSPRFCRHERAGWRSWSMKEGSSPRA
jgi:carboxypeptidase PM20D1